MNSDKNESMAADGNRRSDVVDAAVMLSSMSCLSSSSPSSSSGSAGLSRKESDLTTNESKNGGSSHTEAAPIRRDGFMESLIRAANMASNEPSRKRKASKGPAQRKKGTSTITDDKASVKPRRTKKAKTTKTTGGPKKPRSTKAATTAVTKKGTSKSKRRVVAADAAVSAASQPVNHQGSSQNGQLKPASLASGTTVTDNPGSKLEETKIKAKPTPRRVRATSGKKRIQELESQVEFMGKHVSKLEEENISLRKQVQDLTSDKTKKEVNKLTTTPDSPGTPSQSSITSLSTASSCSSTQSARTLYDGPLSEPINVISATASIPAVVSDKSLATSSTGTQSGNTEDSSIASHQSNLLSITPGPQDKKRAAATVCKAPPLVVTPPQPRPSTTGTSDSQADLNQLLVALLGRGGDDGATTSDGALQLQLQQQAFQQRQEQKTRQEQERPQQQVKEFTSADNNFHHLLLQHFSGQQAGNNKNNNIHQEPHKKDGGLGEGTETTSLTFSLSNAGNQTTSQSQQAASFAELIQQQLLTLQAQPAAAAAAAAATTTGGFSSLLVPQEQVPQQVNGVGEQAGQEALLPFLLQQSQQQQQNQQNQQQFSLPVNPKTTGLNHTNQPGQQNQSPRGVTQLFSIPQPQQLQPSSAAGSPLFTSAPPRTSSPLNHNAAVAPAQSLLSGQSQQNYFSPETLLAILGAQY